MLHETFTTGADTDKTDIASGSNETVGSTGPNRPGQFRLRDDRMTQ
jgi:hypothetical protein